MVLEEESYESISQEIIKTHLELTALIQDINQCFGPLEYLNELNSKGRQKIAALRSNIEQLTILVELERNKIKKAEMLSNIDNHKGQLSTAITAFRKANVASACAIDKMSRENLLSLSTEEQNLIRQRRDKYSAASKSNQITERLLEISKYLADTTQLSENTLDTLVISSDKVSSTKKELEHQQQAIVQSGKLLGKYGRRELTDKALLTLAFAFFLAVCCYIIHRRTF